MSGTGESSTPQQEDQQQLRQRDIGEQMMMQPTANDAVSSNLRKVSLDHMGRERPSLSYPSRLARGYPGLPNYATSSPYDQGLSGAMPSYPPRYSAVAQMENLNFLQVAGGMMNQFALPGLYESMDSMHQTQTYPDTRMMHTDSRRGSTRMQTSMSMLSPTQATMSQYLSPFRHPPTPPPPLDLLMPPEKPEDNDSTTSLSEEAKPVVKRKRAAPSSSFPIKLHKILSSYESSEFIDWLPHGRAWRVLKPRGFEENVLPNYYRSTKYSSFMRQVNGWGFKRITEGCDLNGYYHEMFLRGLPDICAKMRRPPKGGTVNEIGESPDFYRLSIFAPLPDLDDEEDAPPKRKSKSRTPSGKSLSRSSSSSSNAFFGSPGNINVEVPVGTSPQDALSLLSTTGAASASATSSSLLSPPRASLLDTQLYPQILDESLALSPTSLSRASSFGDLSLPQGIPYSLSTCSLGLGETGQQSPSSWGDQNDLMSNVFDPIDAFRPGGQVTPPGSSGFFPWADMSFHDTGGLSVADLCYLTQQNRYLLDQVQGRRNGGH